MVVTCLVFSSLALSSCSLLKAIVSEPLNLIMGSEETKQAKSGSLPEAANYLSESSLKQLFDRQSEQRANGKLLAVLPFMANNNRMLSSLIGIALSDQGEILLVNDQGRLAALPLTNLKPQAVALSLATSLLALADSDGVHLINIQNGKPVAFLDKIRARINSLDFDLRGESLLIAAADSKVYRWKYKDQRIDSSIREREQALERYVGHSLVVSQVLFHPKGRVFFSADWSGKVAAWIRYDADGFEAEYLANAVPGRPFTAEVQRAKAQFQADGSVESLRIGDAGELLAVTSDKGQLALLMVRGFKMLTSIQAHDGLIYDLALSRDGRKAITVGRDDKLKVWVVKKLDLESLDPTEATWELQSEILLPGAYKIALIEGNRVLVGFKNGEILIQSLEVPATENLVQQE